MNLLSQQPDGLPKKKIELSLSSETNTENSASPAPANLRVTLLHRTCKTCPLSAFIEAYCNNNFELLGVGTTKEIAEAWNEILFEWATLIKTEQSEYLFELSRQIGFKQADIFFIENAIGYLRVEWDEEIACGLTALGYDPLNLDLSFSLSKRLVFDLNDLIDEYTRLTNTVEGKKKSEDEFYEDIAMLSKTQHYNIDIQTTTVKQYAAIFNLYLKQNKTTSSE